MQHDTADHETGDASSRKQGSTRLAHASVAVAALVAVATGTVALAAASPAPESEPVAAVSIAVEPETSDDIEVPESPTAGFSDAAARFAEGAAGIPGLVTGSYEATTAEEVLKARREAREALIRAAIAAGIDVDLSRLGDDDQLAALDTFVWPIANPVLTDPFGARGGKHMGMDIAAPGGTPIAAASPGIVVLSSESHYGYGVAVVIQHINGVQTLYGHMTNGSRAVKVGDWVEAGDPIGLVGNTGRSFGNHLHFEVRVNGVPVDPRRYLDGAGKPSDIASWTPAQSDPAPSQPAAPAPAEPQPSAEPEPSQTPQPSSEPQPGTPAPSQTPKPTATPTPTEPAPVPSTPAPSEPAPVPSTPAPAPTPEPTSEPPATTEPEASVPPETPAQSTPPTESAE